MRKRYTQKALESDIELLNEKLKASGKARGFYRVWSRNGYCAVDFVLNSGNVERNIDCAEPPRVLLERAQDHFSHKSNWSIEP